jgi:putative colanic acid biosynthesis UDP-glucose lipid carrier transferase
VHEVYITLPLGSQPRIVELLEQVQGTTASRLLRARRVRHQHHPGPAAGHERRAGGGPLRDPFTGTNRWSSAVSDIVLSLLILVLISPLLLVIAVGVKLSSPGPVIFKQRRNGLDGEEIVVYKFRSMRRRTTGPW